jgi:GAF domain-containing protein
VIAIQNARLFNETNEALEQQRASAEVLSVISNSVADSAPVFQAIVQACQRLFGSGSSIISLVGEDGLVRHEAIAVAGGGVGGFTAEEARSYLDRGYPRPLAQSYQSYPIRKGDVVHYPDIVHGAKVPEGMRQMGRDVGNFSMLIAPLLWEGKGIGTIHVARVPPVPFTDKEFTLLRTFADQAVIAIQNARLFNETKEALERQTATAEVLKVIAASPTDVQPVFEAIAASSNRLVGGFSTAVFRFIADQLHLMAFTRTNPAADAALAAMFPRALAGYPVFVQVREGGVLQLEDTESLAGESLGVRDVARLRGYRAMVFVPLMREGQAVGVISVTRVQPGPFAAKDVQLLQTFGDQAVIAIENVRLFNETREALEQQTATAEVLQVISSSVADTAPVFDKILLSCQKLFSSGHVAIALIGDDGMMHLAQNREGLVETDGSLNPVASRVQGSFPRPVEKSIQGYAIHKKAVVQFADVMSGAGVPKGLRESAVHFGVNFSLMVAPMMWEGRGIGALQVTRIPASAVHRARDQSHQDLRRPGSDRDPERAAVQRDQGGAGAPDRHLGGAGGHQQFGGRHRAGVRQDPAELQEAVRQLAAGPGADHARRLRAAGCEPRLGAIRAAEDLRRRQQGVGQALRRWHPGRQGAALRQHAGARGTLGGALGGGATGHRPLFAACWRR